MSQAVGEFNISMELIDNYKFLVQFDKPYNQLVLDEPPPLGKDEGPNASRILAAAIGNCLSASFLFCARKARARIEKLRTEVRVQLVRNERGRLRIGRVWVRIDPHIHSEEQRQALRCMELFEDFCVVTQSVRNGIPVNVHVVGLSETSSTSESKDT